jgi:hypothetical protein
MKQVLQAFLVVTEIRVEILFKWVIWASGGQPMNTLPTALPGGEISRQVQQELPGIIS